MLIKIKKNSFKINFLELNSNCVIIV